MAGQYGLGDISKGQLRKHWLYVDKKQFMAHKGIDYCAPQQSNGDMLFRFYFIKGSTHRFVCMYVLRKRYIESVAKNQFMTNEKYV